MLGRFLCVKPHVSDDVFSYVTRPRHEPYIVEHCNAKIVFKSFEKPPFHNICSFLCLRDQLQLIPYKTFTSCSAVKFNNIKDFSLPFFSENYSIPIDVFLNCLNPVHKRSSHSYSLNGTFPEDLSSLKNNSEDAVSPVDDPLAKVSYPRNDRWSEDVSGRASPESWKKTCYSVERKLKEVFCPPMKCSKKVLFDFTPSMVIHKVKSAAIDSCNVSNVDVDHLTFPMLKGLPKKFLHLSTCSFYNTLGLSGLPILLGRLLLPCSTFHHHVTTRNVSRESLDTGVLNFSTLKSLTTASNDSVNLTLPSIKVPLERLGWLQSNGEEEGNLAVSVALFRGYPPNQGLAQAPYALEDKFLCLAAMREWAIQSAEAWRGAPSPLPSRGDKVIGVNVLEGTRSPLGESKRPSQVEGSSFNPNVLFYGASESDKARGKTAERIRLGGVRVLEKITSGVRYGMLLGILSVDSKIKKSFLCRFFNLIHDSLAVLFFNANVRCTRLWPSLLFFKRLERWKVKSMDSRSCSLKAYFHRGSFLHLVVSLKQFLFYLLKLDSYISKQHVWTRFFRKCMMGISAGKACKRTLGLTSTKDIICFVASYMEGVLTLMSCCVGLVKLKKGTHHYNSFPWVVQIAYQENTPRAAFSFLQRLCYQKCLSFPQDKNWTRRCGMKRSFVFSMMAVNAVVIILNPDGLRSVSRLRQGCRVIREIEASGVDRLRQRRVVTPHLSTYQGRHGMNAKVNADVVDKGTDGCEREHESVAFHGHESLMGVSRCPESDSCDTSFFSCSEKHFTG